MMDVTKTSPFARQGVGGNNEAHHQKRGRDDSEECEMQVSDENNMDGYARWKRIRGTHANAAINSAQVHGMALGAVQQGAFGQYPNSRPDTSVIARDAEIRGLVSQCATMAASNAELQRALTKSVEENKLLKKAVAIQDNRFREVSQQNERLVADNKYLADENNKREAVLAQAADYVARIESENRVMREYFASMSRDGGSATSRGGGGNDGNDGGGDPYNSFPDFPPPDVY